MRSTFVRLATEAGVLHRIRADDPGCTFCKARGRIPSLIYIDVRFAYYAPDSMYCGKCFPTGADPHTISRARMALLHEALTAASSVEWANEIHNQLLTLESGGDPRR